MADVRQSYWRTTQDEVDAAVPDERLAEGDVLVADAERDLSDPDSEAPETQVDSGLEAGLEVELPAEDITREDAEEAWVPEAHRILRRVAGTYQGLIQYAELAAEIQESSGIHTRRQVRSWIGPVLARVAQLNHERSEPALTALVVHKADGTVGAGYDEALRLDGTGVLEDPLAREKHAAKARLACYEWAGANLPSDGGRPALSPRFEQIHARLRKERRAAEQPTICPTCFMAIPPTGVCDNCG